MCVYIFPARLFPKYLMTQCALILSSSRWHCLIHNDDVMFQITAGIKQKNIIRTDLNDFTAEQLLYAVKFHSEIFISLSLDGGWGE